MKHPLGESNPRSRTENQATRKHKAANDKHLRNEVSGVGPEMGPVTTNPPALEPDLQSIVELWPDLPQAVKAGIVAMVRAAACKS